MKTTITSSDDVGTAINTYLPPWARDWIYGYYDATIGQQREGARVAHQHQARTDNLAELIGEYYSATVAAAPVRAQTGMLRRRLEAAYERGDIDRVPSVKVIRRYVRWKVQEGS